MFFPADEIICAQYRRLALAVSGGRDSCALLHWFAAHKDRYDRLVAVHVNHGLRGAQSDGDEAFVRALCGDYGIDLECRRVDVRALARDNGYTIEQAGREARRAIFARMVREGACERVATAHHRDDLTESVLMHLFRGCGLRGLQGMLPDDGVLLRPMLGVTRAQIDRYCAQNGLQWREDETNADCGYARNRLRNELIPAIETAYPDASERIARLSGAMRALMPFVDDAAPRAVVNERGERVFALDELRRRGAVLQGEAILRAARESGVTTDLEYKHVAAVLRLAEAKVGARVDLPHGLRAYRDRAAITLSKLPPIAVEERAFALGRYDFGEYVLQIGEAPIADGDLRCDLDALNGCTIRARRTGDRIAKFGGGETSLGDYMTELKIPARYRDRIAAIARGSRVLALPPYEISRECAVGAKTRRVCYLHVQYPGKT